MKTLTIKDLPLNEEMDSNDMADVAGGFTTFTFSEVFITSY